jgi:eukaryotic-like serine/threonine-protein kinase
VLDSPQMSGVQLHRPDSGSVVRFGAYEIDLQQGELRKSGLRVRLQEQPLQVLIILLRRPGEVVTREDLRQAIWPEDTFVDFDHALNTAVKKIRAALADDADNPRFIETVPRRGYRFIAPVEKTGQGSPQNSASATLGQPNPSRIFAIVGVVAVVIALVGVALKFVPRHRVESAGSPDFERLTFDPSELSDARFTPDGASVVYSSGPTSNKWTLYTQRIGTRVPQSLGINNALPLSVSATGKLALLTSTDSDPHFETEKATGILAETVLGGDAPRELMTNVGAAEWSPDGQLAVVRQVNGRTRLEFPVGKVLYENTGWISSPRFSPKGDLIAFLDHPISPDDRGNVVVVDLNGRARALSGFWESERGLAWTPNGEEVWFAATRSGVARSLYAVNLNGEERRVLSVAGGLSLEDISRDGRVLLTRDNERLGIQFITSGSTEPRELSWLDWSIAVDLSPDGKKLLFGEEGEGAGPSYQVGLRPTDGSSPVMLGEGVAQSLSPDGNWALSILPPPDDHIVLLPTGAGTPRTLERGPIERYQFERAGWLPDSKQITFAAREPGHTQRCYVQGIDGGKPRAFSPEGMWFCSPSPDGHILAVDQNGRGLLYAPGATGKPEREIKLNHNEAPSGWTNDSKFIYLLDWYTKTPSIVRFELATGRRQVWKELQFPATNTQLKGEELVITPDGQSYAYTYSRHLSDLYLVQGMLR